MKFGVPPKKKWHCAQEELNSPFYPLVRQLNRLHILEYAWKKGVGNKSKFWVLYAVQGDTLFVRVRSAVAKAELNVRKNMILKELNKYFKKPWIKDIKIQ